MAPVDPLATVAGRFVAGATDARRNWLAPVLLAAIGSLVFVLGMLVYLGDRAASPPALVPAFALLATGSLFGTLGQWLPSFVHPFSFSLFTAAARAPGSSPAYGACAAWWVVNVAFEAGQHPRLNTALADGLQHGLGTTAPVQWLSNYFARGTFDAGDLVAATAGALAAAGVIYLVHRVEARHAQ